MRETSVGEIARIVGGRLHGSGEDAAVGVTKDSRDDCAGLLYAAIPGSNADGHDFIGTAFEKGAVCALANRVPQGETRPVIVVPDVENAIRTLAAAYRASLSIPVVGITGSVGKTTTKEMTAAVLSQRYRVHKTEKNFNNELGVPLTLLKIEPEDEVSVVEMGISDFGEMTRLAAMARPTMAVYTVIGHSHLEKLRDRQGVFTAKTEMLPFLPENGTVFANGDDDLLRAMACPQKKVFYGVGSGVLRAENIAPEGLSGTRCDIVGLGRRIAVNIPAYGRHMVYAALAGASVGIELGLTDEQIAAGIEGYVPVGRRSNPVKVGDIVLIDDCYNSNPDSVKSAVDSLSILPGRKVCVLGDMLELGEDTRGEHRRVGEYAALNGADVVITAGPLSADISSAAESAGVAARRFADISALINALPELLQPGDNVLVKASHSMCFDRVSEAIKEMKS